MIGETTASRAGTGAREEISLDGAWRFRLDEGWWLREALPLRWRFRDWAPQNLQR